MTTSTDIAQQITQGLNDAQRQAVETTEGPLLIVAGPGSGKTRVITHRIAYLVRVCGVSPFRILAVTFTNKAAREMKERLARLVGPRSNDLTVGTFHAICAQILRRDGSFVGVEANYTIYDTDDQLGLIKKALDLLELDQKKFPPRAVLSVISHAKSVLLEPEGLAAQKRNYFDEKCAQVYQQYQEALARNNAVDFDDLLLKTVRLLQNSGEVRLKYRQRYQYVLVDEFQDTNVAQYRLTRLLTGEHNNLCVVGDPDQSIYSWRNADIRNILSFQKDYPAARTINLEQNYRSTGTILEAAKCLIANNGKRLKKDLFTANPGGAPVALHEAYNEQEEADFIIREVERLARQEKLRPGDCAVLYRVNAQSRALEEACLQRGMKYRLVGGVRFYQRKEVKDVMAYLRLLHNPQDEVNLLRVINMPPRGVGAKSLQDLQDWAQRRGISLYQAMRQLSLARARKQPSPLPGLTSRAARSIADFADMIDGLIRACAPPQAKDGAAPQLPLAEPPTLTQIIDRLLEESGLRRFIQTSDDNPEERWDNVLELRATAQEFNAMPPQEALASLLERLSLVAEVDNLEETADSLTLITLHQAKGLEFPVVFIAGLEDGLLPHSRSMESEEQLEEERRLCYVGITRAQQRLYLTRAFRRGFSGAYGDSGPTIASRFLEELPQELLAAAKTNRRGLEPERQAVTAPREVPSVFRQPPAVATPPRLTLKTGDRVRHAAFGEGVVQSCVPAGGDFEVVVQFRQAGAKKLLLSYAPLEKLEG